MAEGKKTLSMEQRLLLAFVLMGGVIFLSQYLLPKPPQSAAQKKAAEATKKQEAPASAAPAATPAPAGETAAPTVATQADYPVFENDLYRVKFSNKGAVVLEWSLKQFKDAEGKPLNLVNDENVTLLGTRPFAYQFKEQKPSSDLNEKLFAVTRTADGVAFDYNDGSTVARKSFRFIPGRYLADVDSSVAEKNAAVTHALVWRGGFGDHTVQKAYAAQFAVYLPPSDSSPTTFESSKAKDAPIVNAGNYVFAGLQDQYFAAVALPKPGQTIELTALSDSLPYPAKSTDHMPFVGASLSIPGRNQFTMFVGPKDLDLLAETDKRLVSLVDWGWFGWIGRPLFAALRWLDSHVVNNWGWSIILLTVLINLALIPLKLSSMRSMKKMQSLQPEIQRINDKYKGVGFNDPRKQDQNKEVMDLYNKHGVNPAGGCVPMLLQFPFFIGFYKVLNVATELRGTPWFWVKDLSQPETIPVRILPLLMIGSQFYLQKMTPTSGMDPSQARMMLLMPLMMGFLFYNASSGLVLYWLTGNLVGIAQQLLFNKLMPASPAPQLPAKKKAK
ncbi:MAG TPA: membrane protein insertase YidC [Bryobacteraceae bacterium]|nr:membrane protein insertase YidC [Bryobacteraceae bacterium]